MPAKKKKLTLFGRLLFLLLFGGGLAVAGEMIYVSFVTKTVAKNELSINNTLNNGFRLANKAHDAGVLKSRGSFDVLHEDLCSQSAFQIGTFVYEVTHLPFQPDLVTAMLLPSRDLQSTVVRERDAKTGDEKPIVLFTGYGDISNEGVLSMRYTVPALQWVNRNSGDFYQIQSIEGDLEVGPSGYKMDGVLRDLRASLDRDDVKLEILSFKQAFSPKSESAFVASITANKIKSDDVFVRGFSLDVKGSLKDNILVVDGNTGMELMSHKGNPVENFKATFDANVNDFRSFVALRNLLSATCNGKMIDEENRVDLRLNTTRIVDQGLSLGVSGVSWTGPRGEAFGSARLRMEKVIDENSGLPDFHGGLVGEAKLTLDPLYRGMPMLQPIWGGDYLVKEESVFKMELNFRERGLAINGKPASVTNPVEVYINDLASEWSPRIGRPLTVSSN